MASHAEVRLELDRTVDLLRGASPAKLAALWPTHGSRAAGARSLAQSLADRAAAALGEPVRAVPDIGDSAVGDQVAVTGADLLACDLDEASLDAVAAELVAFRRAF